MLICTLVYHSEFLLGIQCYSRELSSTTVLFVYPKVIRMKTDLQREHDRKLQEVREASRRMKEDCDHQVELERSVIRGIKIKLKKKSI